jgi:hypothetical protein
MLALSSAAQDESLQMCKFVVLVTIGGISSRHLPYLVRRAERQFPSSRLVVCDWGDSVPPSYETDTKPDDFDALSCSTLGELLGAMSCSRESSTPTTIAA